MSPCAYALSELQWRRVLRHRYYLPLLISNALGGYSKHRRIAHAMRQDHKEYFCSRFVKFLFPVEPDFQSFAVRACQPSIPFQLYFCIR